ncbi:MAG: hypothetical protein ACRDF4_05990, partial [Rhabdochlamydiaceae bacterium]
MVKRFLFHDPYYQISLARLVMRLWEVELFYAVVFLAFITIAKRPAFRRYMLWIGIGILPNILLSVRWDGAALERHMPLLIFFFVAMALWFEAGSKSGRAIFISLIIVVGLVNISGLWYATNANKEQVIDRQVEELWHRLKPASRVAVLSSQDEISEFQGIHPFDSFNQSSKLQLFPVVQLGFKSARYWKQTFADSVAQYWIAGGDVWISKNLLKSKPGESTYWAENADPGVAWAD